MTREEEIKQAANDIFDIEDQKRLNQGFIKGAEWADQHPKEGLWDAEKVCDFIASHLTDKSIINNWQLPYQTVQDFIEDLHKAMEE